MSTTTNDAIASRAEITAWLVEWIAADLRMQPEEIDTARSLLDYSLSSVTATILVGDLEDWLKLRLPPTLAWDYPSIDSMTDYLLAKAKDGAERPAHGAAVTGQSAPDANELLEGLDNLSDAEVDALLKQLSE